MAAGETKLQLLTLPPPPPPTEFRRTISWQLSQVQDYGDTREKERLKRKKQRKRERREQESAEQQAERTRQQQQQSKEEDTGSDGGEVVLGSDGEELYYSAPEYPLTSSDSEPESPLVSHDTSHDTLLYRNKPGKSKKQKKKRTKIARHAAMEFFQPLCDMVEEKICIDTEDKELTSKTAVPSLVEICLRSLQKISLTESEENLPYLLTSLLRQSREMSNIVSGHVRWLERFLGTSELYLAFQAAKKAKKKKEKKEEKEVDPPQAYLIQDVWDLENRVISDGDFRGGDGHHAPLPAPTYYTNCLKYWNEYSAFKKHSLAIYRTTLHYINYMYPRLVHEPALNQRRTKRLSQPSSPSSPRSSSSSSSVIKSNIRRVNLWLTTRYPHLMKLTQEASCLWPAYVHWARGNLKLATDDFIAATKLLENCYDQAIALNEMARMFVHFGERSDAVQFYRKSVDINLLHTREYDVKYDSQLVPLCSLALQASVWSTGVQDQYSALQSSCAWEAVLTAARNGIPTHVWFLHAAAAESLLFTHAGYPVGSSEASAQRIDSQVEQWLNDCEKMLMREKDAFPVLNYYLSLIYAMKGNELKSKRTFEAYINDFAGFKEWDNGVFPGYQYSSWLAPAHLRKSPWLHLINLLEAERWSHAAILPLKWRVQLLHPLHPYPKNVGLSYIADHAPSTNLGFRLTPDGRYLTADIHMDMPPMRCVLMDPYNGSLCFSRVTSLQHYTYSNGSETEDGESSLPWPIRLYESSKCTVELTMAQTQVAYTHDLFESNYLAMLHWYGSDGRVLKLDLRILIRREMKKAMLDEAKSLYSNEDELKTVESHIDKLVERGLELDIKNVKLKKKPRKDTLDNTCGVGETLCREFVLKLVSHIMIGSATILLSFHLTNASSHTNLTNTEVLVFVNCQDSTSFLHPSIHCCPHSFRYVYPHSKVAAPYPFYHMSHINYVITVEVYPCTTKKHDLIYFLVFDEFGNEICRHLIFEGHQRLGLASLSRDCVIGSRVVNVDERTHVVTSCNVISRKEQSSDRHTSAVVNQATDILTVPGLLLVVCNGGLCLLHPGTLERVTVEGMRESDTTASPSQDGILYPQFPTLGVADVSILKVVDVICKEQEKETIEDEPKETLAGKKEDPKEDEVEEESTSTAAEDVHFHNDNVDFGSCRVVLSINDRLLVLHCTERTEKVVVLLDVDLPGKPTEVHLMDSYGYLVSCSQFPDMYYDDLYWLSSNGRLLGMLPCLKGGNHSFYSTVLPPRHTNSSSPAEATLNEEDVATACDDSGGLHVYFDDGRGGICCLRPKDVLQ